MLTPTAQCSQAITACMIMQHEQKMGKNEYQIINPHFFLYTLEVDLIRAA